MVNIFKSSYLYPRLLSFMHLQSPTGHFSESILYVIYVYGIAASIYCTRSWRSAQCWNVFL